MNFYGCFVLTSNLVLVCFGSYSKCSKNFSERETAGSPVGLRRTSSWRDVDTHTQFVIVAFVLMCINSGQQSSLNIWISRHKSLPNPDGQTALARLKGIRIKPNISQCVRCPETNCLIRDFYALTPLLFDENVKASSDSQLRRATVCHFVTVCPLARYTTLMGCLSGAIERELSIRPLYFTQICRRLARIYSPPEMPFTVRLRNHQNGLSDFSALDLCLGGSSLGEGWFQVDVR